MLYVLIVFYDPVYVIDLRNRVKRGILRISGMQTFMKEHI